PTAGVPDSVAVPLPLSSKLTPVGSVPVSRIDVTSGFSTVVVTVKLPGAPTPNVAAAALVNADDADLPEALLSPGLAAPSTASVNACVALPSALVAVRFPVVEPAEVGAPEIDALAVPPLNESPAGSAPLSVMVAVGLPLVVIENTSLEPTVNDAVDALVNVGAPGTTNCELDATKTPPRSFESNARNAFI